MSKYDPELARLAYLRDIWIRAKPLPAKPLPGGDLTANDTN